MAGNALDLRDIQGHFGGYDRPWPVGRFYYCRYRTCEAGRRLLTRLMPLSHSVDVDAGTDLAVHDRVSVRVRFDVPIFMRYSDSYTGIRFSAGITIPFGGR